MSGMSDLSISAWFWNPQIWLPPNVTWESFEENSNSEAPLSDGLDDEEGRYAKFSDLMYPIPMAIMMMFLRWGVEKFIFRPIGLQVGMKDSRKSYPRSNPILEAEFRKSKNPTQAATENLSKATSMTELEVQRWFRQRKSAELPSTLQKFCETGWRFVFYTGVFLYGAVVLWSKHWFWNINNCFIEYPHHKVTNDVWFYYMVEMAFYWSLSFSQFFDVKRKDFWEMFIHHQATIALIGFSWTTHFVRIGTLVLIVHDCGDPLLELAKLLRYAKYCRASEAVLVVFTPIWVISRCVIYPGWILKSTIFDAIKLSAAFPAYYFFNFLLCLLQCLHVMWTYLLFKAIQRSFTAKSSIDDIRSDSESESSTDQEQKKKMN